MSYVDNVLQAVTTIKDIANATMQNMNPVFSNADKMFDNFQDFVANLGDSVQFSKVARATSVRSLNLAVQAAVERVERLTCDKPFSASQQYSETQLLFNVDPYNWEKSWIKAAVNKLANDVEVEAAKDFTIYPYRFVGDGRTPITQFLDISRFLMQFRNFGSPADEAKFFLPDFAVPSICNSGLNQFAMDRNDEMAMSWEIADYNRCRFLMSNNLALHTAGTEGTEDSTLTVVSTTKNSAGQITHITFSGTAETNDVDSVKKGDRFRITTANTSLLNFTSYNRVVNAIQFMAAADAEAVGGEVTVELRTPLYPGESLSDAISISTDIVAGMTANVADSHYAGCIYAGKTHMVANPQMGNMSPYVTSWQTDPDTGTTIRAAYGTDLTTSNTILRLDTLTGSAMNPDTCMAVLFPVNQGY